MAHFFKPTGCISRQQSIIFFCVESVEIRRKSKSLFHKEIVDRSYIIDDSLNKACCNKFQLK